MRIVSFPQPEPLPTQAVPLERPAPRLITFPPEVNAIYQGKAADGSEVTRVAFKRSFCQVSATAAGEKRRWSQAKIDQDMKAKVEDGRARAAIQGAENAVVVSRGGRQFVGFWMAARKTDELTISVKKTQEGGFFKRLFASLSSDVENRTVDLNVRTVGYLYDTPKVRIWANCQALEDHVDQEAPLFEGLLEQIVFP